MFLFSFLYPRPKARDFDYDYHRRHHMALGIGLAKLHLGIQPKMFWVERIGEDDPQSEEKYCAIVHLAFETQDDRDRLFGLMNVPEAVEQLFADYAHYTDTPPEVRVSRMTIDDDIPAIIEQFNMARTIA